MVFTATDRYLLALTSLVVFVALDVLDGVWARAGRSGDSAARRGLDSIVDRSAVWLAFGAAALSDGWFWIPALWMIAISVVSMPIAWTSWRVHGLVLRAPRWHRIWSLLAAGAGATFLLGFHGVGLALAIGSSLASMLCTAQVLRVHRGIAKDE